jgi:hypothetical protein
MSAPTWRVFHSPRAGRRSGSRSFAGTVCKGIRSRARSST